MFGASQWNKHFFGDVEYNVSLMIMEFRFCLVILEYEVKVFCALVTRCIFMVTVECIVSLHQSQRLPNFSLWVGKTNCKADKDLNCFKS